MAACQSLPFSFEFPNCLLVKIWVVTHRHTHTHTHARARMHMHTVQGPRASKTDKNTELKRDRVLSRKFIVVVGFEIRKLNFVMWGHIDLSYTGRLLMNLICWILCRVELIPDRSSTLENRVEMPDSTWVNRFQWPVVNLSLREFSSCTESHTHINLEDLAVFTDILDLAGFRVDNRVCLLPTNRFIVHDDSTWKFDQVFFRYI